MAPPVATSSSTARRVFPLNLLKASLIASMLKPMETIYNGLQMKNGLRHFKKIAT